MVNLKCERCGREWDYKGSKEFYCSCPDCKTSIRIKPFPHKQPKSVEA